jgi:ParB family chromosome partitioning protein
VRSEGFAEADSLAENTEREALHPLDQFRAFAALRDKGEGEETIAAAFGVTAAVVKQRLRLAKASPILLKAHEDDEISLDQLMAFCLVDDHQRQEQVWSALKTHWNKGPDAIRRMLTESAEAYKAAGGIIIRDLFDEDEGGWLQVVPMLEKLAAEKLETEAAKIRAEGWGWVEAALDFAWNHHRSFTRLKPVTPALSAEEETELEAITGEYEELDALRENDLTEEARQRLEILTRRLEELESRSPTFDPGQMAKACAFVIIRDNGAVYVERGFQRPEDATPKPPAPANAQSGARPAANDAFTAASLTGEKPDNAIPLEDEEAGTALPERLLTELTAYRSLALREALANDHDWAYLAVLHALALRLFYHRPPETCLQISAHDDLVPPFPGLADFAAARAIEARHKAWQEALPDNPALLWDTLLTLNNENREALFAHCAGLTINAVHEPEYRVSPRKRHADQLASALGLDMIQAGWVTGAANYFSRVTKARILAAVTEAKGEGTAELLAGHKKKEMAVEAERLLAGSGWLPEPLRTPALPDETPAEALPAFLENEAA